MSHIKNIQNALGSRGLDGMLLLSPANRRYATGFFTSDGAVVVTRDAALFFTDDRYIEAARKKVADAEVRLVSGAGKLLESVKDAVSGLPRLGVEEESLSHAEYLRYERELAPAELVFAQELLSSLRVSKSQAELEDLIAAQRIAERALEDVLGMLRPGLTENEVTAELIYRMLQYGGEGNSFDPIVVAGKKSSKPHGAPGDNKIQAGDFVTMDFGCLKNGYCSDMTRTVAVGFATDEMKRVYNTVLEAQLAGIAAVRAGVVGEEIDAAARKVIADAGYGDCFGHSFGHGLGIRIHEAPNAAPGARNIVPEGAVISAEPGIYLPGRFGVRIEDVLYVTETGSVNITKASKELIIV